MNRSPDALTFSSASCNELARRITSISQQQRSWTTTDWPSQQLAVIADAQVYRWFASPADGGLGWTPDQIAQGYVALGSACLTSTFIVTQRVAALKRLASCANEDLKRRVLPGMLDGSATGTVGISHLTTSRRHVGEPAVRVMRQGDSWLVDGFAPWVTGARQARWLLMGGELVGGDRDDREELLFLLSTDTDGVTIEQGFDLMALSASQTGGVKCESVLVPDANIIAGPKESVLATRAGGVQTSALALGLVRSAVDFIHAESVKRRALAATAEALGQQFELLLELTIQVARGQHELAGQLRADANSLVLRSTQAALIAAKGAGFVAGHPVGRWCREAMFFLVWSCPQQVAEAGLCELVARSE